MSFIDREIAKVAEGINASSDARREKLYVAQQALNWATDPYAFRSPFNYIMDIQADSASCLECLDQLPS